MVGAAGKDRQGDHDPDLDPIHAEGAPAFALRDMSDLFVADRGLFQRFKVALGEGDPPHRAGDDAARLCRALVLAEQHGQRIEIQHVDLDCLAGLFAQR